MLGTQKVPINNSDYYLFFKLVFIGVQLIYNVVLVSAVQQWISCIYTCIHSFLESFSIQVITGYRVEIPLLYSRSLLLIYLYTVVCQCVYVNPNLPIYPSSPFHPVIIIPISAHKKKNHYGDVREFSIFERVSHDTSVNNLSIQFSQGEVLLNQSNYRA